MGTDDLPLWLRNEPGGPPRSGKPGVADAIGAFTRRTINRFIYHYGSQHELAEKTYNLASSGKMLLRDFCFVGVVLALRVDAQCSWMFDSHFKMRAAPQSAGATSQSQSNQDTRQACSCIMRFDLPSSTAAASTCSRVYQPAPILCEPAWSSHEFTIYLYFVCSFLQRSQPLIRI